MGLKILHVTNVAQNAYVNAKILSARGHDCDLLAFDLYHVACSPEWYELMTAEVDVKLIGDDPFFPNFYALGCDMPVVSDWVAHGPMAIAMRYLIMKRRGDPRAHLALSVLSYFRFKATMQRTTMPYVAAMPDDEFERRLNAYQMPSKLRRRIRLGRTAESYSEWIRKRLEYHVTSSHDPIPTLPVSPEMMNLYCEKDRAIMNVVKALRARELSEIFAVEYRSVETETAHLEKLNFERDEVLSFVGMAAMWRELTALYDVCIFYGDSTNHALTSGLETYHAIEHGTIRSVPFTETVHGRLLSESYKKASRVFLTNTDYATASPRLEFAPEQRIYFPHPFDEAHANAFRTSHSSRLDPTRAVFFCPARQEWTSGSLDLTKGNDLYFRAGRMLIDCGRSDFVFHCIDWGLDRDASRKLVAELDLGAHVRWLPMLPKRALWAAMIDAHAVIDQFYLSALGGVGIETLALGRRLISRDDGINNAVFFETPPPVLAAATAEEVATQMLTVMDDPEDTAGRGEAGVAWIAAHHSADRIYDLQMAAFGFDASTAEVEPHIA